MKLSIILPTYNNDKTLDACLKSIFIQDYPRKDFEVVLIDGGSTDKTLEIVKKYPVKLKNNPKRVEEPARINAIKNSKAEVVAMIDADNVLIGKDFIRKMMKPFEDKEIMYVDSLYYGYRKEDMIRVKYQALIGGDDPFATYFGFHSRWCYFKDNWTDFPIRTEKKKEYDKVWILNKDLIPSVGSNGFFVRRKIFWPYVKERMIHPDFIWEMVKDGYNCMAKVDAYLIHDQRTFFKNKIRRMKRRIAGEIRVDYDYGITKAKLIKTILRMILVLPITYDVIKGFIRKPEKAWLFHYPACFGLVFLYSYYTFIGAIKKIVK